MNDNDPDCLPLAQKRIVSATTFYGLPSLPEPTATDDDIGKDTRTLAKALADAIEARWEGRRSADSLPPQARKGMDALSLAVRPDLSHLPTAERLKLVCCYEVRPAHIKHAVRMWKEEGIKPRLINRRLVCMSAVGFSVKGHYQRVPKELKWWLKPEEQAVLIKHLAADGESLLSDYIVWATSTGFRIEETLRLTRADFTDSAQGSILVTVPGLKTYDAQATLPLSTAAIEVYRRRFGTGALPSDRLFDVAYWKLAERWRIYRTVIGAGKTPGATLKALRRVSARNLHVEKSMPLDLVRHYLRHENVQTTMGYLRLTGGYSTDEFAKYL